ncbi:hypothetical protein BH23ACT11_BH23ACT11_00740 [soil metagenome]
MGKIQVRQIDDPALEKGVGQLRIDVHPHLPEVYDVDFYFNIYRWLEIHPAGDKMMRWAVVDDDKVVGHLAAMPQHYRINGQRVIAHTPGDYMTLPQYGFQALSLMRNYFRATDNYVSCDMVPAVIKVETRLGAEVAGKLSYAAKLMNVSRLPMPTVPGPIRKVLNLADYNAPARGFDDRAGNEVQDANEYMAPPPTRPRAPIPGPIKRLLNGGLWAVDEVLGRGLGGPLEAVTINEFDSSFDELFEKVAAAVPCTPEKDAAFLNWRYGPGSPQYPAKVLGVKDGDTLLGYAVLLVTSSGQDSYISDLMTLPGRHDVARALLRESIRYFRETGAQIIRYRFAQSATAPRANDLKSQGFFLREGRENSILTKFSDPTLHKTATDIKNWSYTVGDGEASFWIR